MDRPARKRTNSSFSGSSAPSSLTTIRRRRFIICILLVALFVFCFGVPWELPEVFRDMDAPSVNRGNVVELVKPETKVSEMFGLLHLVTDEEHEHVLSLSLDVDPTKPIKMSVYAAGEANLNWNTIVNELNAKFPIVVFSKTYCPFSTRAKALLGAYKLDPPPKVVEVDLRDDNDIMKPLLTRLTSHSTFPNIVVHGKSIGGADELQQLHASGELTKIIQNAGVTIAAEDTSKGLKVEVKNHD